MRSTRTTTTRIAVAAAAAVVAATAGPAAAAHSDSGHGAAQAAGQLGHGPDLLLPFDHETAHAKDDEDRISAAALASDFSFLSPVDPPARWNPCDYIDWKATLHGAPKDGLNTIVEAVRRVEAASGLRFRYQGISTFVPTLDNPTEAGLDITVAWVEHTATDMVVPRTGLGGSWLTSAMDSHGRHANELFQGYAVMESTSFREMDALVERLVGDQRVQLAKIVRDTSLNLTMHELGHAIGLGHATGTDQVMSPGAAGVVDWGPGDLAGISQLGAANSCLGRTRAEATGSVPPALPGPDLLPPGEVPPMDPVAPVLPERERDAFTDIASNAHAKAIRKVAAANITSGYPDGTFRPGADVTRGQMATFLARALGLAPVYGTRFPDSAGHAHEKSINAVAEVGITLGDGKGGFAPDETVTRAQMATFLVRSFGLTESRSGLFTDTKGNAHEKSIDVLGATGISLGDGKGRFGPGGKVNRGQMATFLSRSLGL